MKYILFFFIFFLNSFSLHAEDALTVKQQLDRIMEEVKDLNKAVFNKSFKSNELVVNQEENDTQRFTSIDIRIYDLEKDIKNLTLQFEEILFKLDDLSNEINLINSKLISSIKNNETNLESKNIKLEKEEKNEDSALKKENTLGTLTISDNDQITNKVDSENSNQQNKKNIQVNKKLTPEEQLQFALDQMIKKNYENSKKTLEYFILQFPDNQLSGSAHFWLGKIYLFELNYRKAAIIFGEGVQKFPKSIKAAEMYYELAKSLKEMEKIPEACKTLSLLFTNYEENKFSKDPDKVKESLNCESLN